MNPWFFFDFLKDLDQTTLWLIFIVSFSIFLLTGYWRESRKELGDDDKDNNPKE